MDDDLESIFKHFLDDSFFQEVLSLVKMNSKGKIWIIGGFIYRNIAAKFNNAPFYNFDIDFIVEEKNIRLLPVEGWSIRENNYGN